MGRRECPHHAAVVEQLGQERRLASQVDRLEAGVLLEETIDDLFVLLWLTRAGRVDEAAAWGNDVRGAGEQCELVPGQVGEVRFGSPPSDVRVAAHGAEAGT